jgi:hypothetical protein
LERSGSKEKIMGKSERQRFVYGRRKSLLFLEGSQAIPACPSDKDSVRVKRLRWKLLRHRNVLPVVERYTYLKI